jgi:hypothetical protein
MGGSPQAGSAPLQDAGGDPLGALLGGLLGGGMSPSGGLPAQGTGGGDPLSSFLGGLQGGGPAAPDASAASADPMSALLGGLLGGGMQGGPAGAGAGSLGNNAFLAPIVEAIASKIGLPPQIGGVVVSFALNQLMGGQRDPQLAQMLGGKGIVSQKYLRDSGLVSQLAEQTGMDNKSAVKSLQQVFKAFGTQMSEGTMEKRQADLQSWLATS